MIGGHELPILGKADSQFLDLVRAPKLDVNGNYNNHCDYDATASQIRYIMEATRRSECNALLLSVFGCGAYGNPPAVVAKLFRPALKNVNDVLHTVIFCIIDDHNVGKRHNPRGNFAPFHE